MKGIASTLKLKFLGVVPVWMLLLFVVIGGVWYIKRKGSASTDTSGDTTATPSTLDTSDLVNGLPSQSTTYITVGGPTGVITPPSNGGPTSTPPGDGRITSAPTAPTPVGGGSAPSRPPGGSTPAPIGGGASKTKTLSYAVKQGDTIDAIARAEKTTKDKLVAANESVITNTAKQHGYTGNFADHIFPGEKLVIPA